MYAVNTVKTGIDMATTMKFTGKCSRDDDIPHDILVFGTPEFPNMPLFSSRVSTSRREGVSVKKHDCVLTGFVRGINHYETRLQLATIRSFSVYNHVHFLYYANDVGVVNNQVYIDNVTEPTDWKEYNAKYTITFHYFTCPCEDDPIGSPVTAVTKDGETYTFSPQPIFSISTANIRKSPWVCNKTLYDGVALGQKVIMNFTGVLCAATHEELVNKMSDLDEVVKNDFVLTYGDWTEWVFVEKPASYAISDFTTHAIYQFSVSYYTGDIYEMESKVVFTRQHKYPKVTPRLYCGITEVDEFHESGQYITYSLRILSLDPEKTRLQLGQEFGNMIVGGGVLMQGGNESWNEDGSMSVTSMFYYEEPVLPLVELNQDIPTELEHFKCEKEEPVPSP